MAIHKRVSTVSLPAGCHEFAPGEFARGPSVRVTGHAGSDAVAESDYVHTSARNDSLGSRGRHVLFGVTAAVAAMICACAAASGAWPVLPFSALYLALFYIALKRVDLHAADYERVTISGSKVLIEVRDGLRCASTEFERYWLRVAYDADRAIITLRSHGRELTLGRHLCPDERLEWRDELERALRPPEPAHRSSCLPRLHQEK